jgi:hypothetical protein
MIAHIQIIWIAGSLKIILIGFAVARRAAIVLNFNGVNFKRFVHSRRWVISPVGDAGVHRLPILRIRAPGENRLPIWTIRSALEEGFCVLRPATRRSKSL